MKRTIKLSLTPREFDTILAALRLFQRPQAWLANYGDVDITDIATEHGDIMTSEEVDELCERHNR